MEQRPQPARPKGSTANVLVPGTKEDSEKSPVHVLTGHNAFGDVRRPLKKSGCSNHKHTDTQFSTQIQYNRKQAYTNQHYQLQKCTHKTKCNEKTYPVELLLGKKPRCVHFTIVRDKINYNNQVSPNFQ